MRWLLCSLIGLALAVTGGPSFGQPGGKAMMKRPKKQPATLTVTSSPPAGVTIDGGYRGRTPLTLKLDPGTRHVVLETQQGQREERTITIERGGSLTISHRFSQGDADAVRVDSGGSQTPYLKALERQNLGVLVVSATPPGRLFLDGNDVRRMTPVSDLEATAGTHALKIEFVTGGEKELQVEVRAGERTHVKIAQ